VILGGLWSHRMFENSVVDHHWLVVLTCLTILKNMKVYESEWEGLSHILWKKHVPNHQPVIIFSI
jgi:hypothetical protein